MKLHIGCGDNYRPGYINIDAYNDKVADRIMPAALLDFPDDHIELIESYHLIEHLGYFHAMYALAEWYRVLKPGGSLIVETPDIDRSIREFSQSKKYQVQAELFNWIYGRQAPGMGHRFCFTPFLLRTFLENAGFTGIRKKPQETHLYSPGFRMTGRKESDQHVFTILSHFRRALQKAHLIDFDDHRRGLFLEEHFLIPFSRHLKDYFEQGRHAALDKIFLQGKRRDLKITRLFLRCCAETAGIPEEKLRRFREVTGSPVE